MKFVNKIIPKVISTSQKIIIKHFNISPYGLCLRRYKNKFRERRCFIIGNGPSLKAEDLEKLQDEITFAFNRIYLIFSKTKWRPTFYISEDPKILKNSAQEISDLKHKHKFIPINVKWFHDIHIRRATYFYQYYGKLYPELPGFSSDITKQIDCGGTVAYAAFQMAAYMGFKYIYLLGIDHSFNISQNVNGKIVIDAESKDYFIESYNNDKEKLDIPNLDRSRLAYVAAKKYADTNDLKIYNATRGGKLEVFERVNFDEIDLKKITEYKNIS